MQYRRLGRTGLDVSEIGFGAWGIGGAMWKGSDDGESLAALSRAIELGVNFIDTALAYGHGHSELLVGKLVHERGTPILVATKVPPKNHLWPARPGVGIEEVFPHDYIIRSTEQSLRNLGVETIDLQQLHVWNPEWLASEEWRRGFEEIKASGKVRFVGVSINDHQPDSALELIRTGLVDTVQVIYNIFDQTPDKSLFPLCVREGIGVIARVPFDEGSLTGSITAGTVFPSGDFRERYFRGDRKVEVERRVNALKSDLAHVDGSLPEIALRFCLSHPAVSTVIPGMRKIRNVETNCAASAQAPLDEETLAKLANHAWENNFYGGD